MKLKGELKAKISHFSNIFFGKPNISKLKLVELYLLVSCFLRENYVRSWAFPAFSAFSVRPKSALFPPFFFFGKPNISKVKFVELFLLVSCFLRENYVRSWAFPAFSAFSERLHFAPFKEAVENSFRSVGVFQIKLKL